MLDLILGLKSEKCFFIDVHVILLLCNVRGLNNEAVTPGREQIFGDIT